LVKIRDLRSEDLYEISKLHNKYYSEFDFPRFANMINAFVIEDEKNDIVMAGAVELVGEAVLVTNKEKSRIKIGKALVEAQRCSVFTCKVSGIRDLYAFVKDDEYAKHLIQHGFSDCDRALNLRITNGQKEAKSR
jgi:hypothetical protein